MTWFFNDLKDYSELILPYYYTNLYEERDELFHVYWILA